MERVIKRNGKLIQQECNDGYFKHVKETVIGTYTDEEKEMEEQPPLEKEDKPQKRKSTKKGADE